MATPMHRHLSRQRRRTNPTREREPIGLIRDNVSGRSQIIRHTVEDQTLTSRVRSPRREVHRGEDAVPVVSTIGSDVGRNPLSQIL